MPAIPMGKSRTKDNPYLILRWRDWEWRVLKAYSTDPDKPYARWFCAVSSSNTFGGFDMGDTYISDIADVPVVVAYRDPEVPDSALPKALRRVVV